MAQGPCALRKCASLCISGLVGQATQGWAMPSAIATQNGCKRHVALFIMHTAMHAATDAAMHATTHAAMYAAMHTAVHAAPHAAPHAAMHATMHH
eukprot:1150026-Pelagomonas_calceolata.AAC.3